MSKKPQYTTVKVRIETQLLEVIRDLMMRDPELIRIAASLNLRIEEENDKQEG
jgi:hypothetical protein